MMTARPKILRLLALAAVGLVFLFVQILLNTRLQKALKTEEALERQIGLERHLHDELVGRLDLATKPDRVFLGVDRGEYRRVNPERILVVRFKSPQDRDVAER
ncbi:MAG: hypothetical protein J0L75_19525 [Spirochaetes bacterium]|nr:hypothetical protein [Spirochaetota bacterium]